MIHRVRAAHLDAVNPQVPSADDVGVLHENQIR
jgi:hypothetical protein